MTHLTSLAAAVWTRDIFKAFRAVKAVRAGVVWVNHMQPTYVEARGEVISNRVLAASWGRGELKNILRLKQVHINLNEQPIGWYELGTIRLRTAIPGQNPRFWPSALPAECPPRTFLFDANLCGEGGRRRLEDVDGNRYIDFAGGIGCKTRAIAGPVVSAIRQQSDQFLHTAAQVTPTKPTFA